MSITVATTNKTVGESMCSSKGKQSMFPIRRPPCYSCSSPVEVVSLIEERKHQHKRDDIYYLFNTIFLNDQPVMYVNVISDIDLFHPRQHVYTPRYTSHIAKGGVKHQSINTWTALLGNSIFLVRCVSWKEKEIGSWAWISGMIWRK
jgi:hypothetical protein